MPPGEQPSVVRESIAALHSRLVLDARRRGPTRRQVNTQRCTVLSLIPYTSLSLTHIRHYFLVGADSLRPLAIANLLES